MSSKNWLSKLRENAKSDTQHDLSCWRACDAYWVTAAGWLVSICHPIRMSTVSCVTQNINTVIQLHVQRDHVKIMYVLNNLFEEEEKKKIQSLLFVNPNWELGGRA